MEEHNGAGLEYLERITTWGELPDSYYQCSYGHVKHTNTDGVRGGNPYKKMKENTDTMGRRLDLTKLFE